MRRKRVKIAPKKVGPGGGDAMTAHRKIPDDLPFHGPKERPLGPYLAFMLLEFWLLAGGVALLFFWPLWGGVVIGVAVVLFLLAITAGG